MDSGKELQWAGCSKARGKVQRDWNGGLELNEGPLPVPGRERFHRLKDSQRTGGGLERKAERGH